MRDQATTAEAVTMAELVAVTGFPLAATIGEADAVLLGRSEQGITVWQNDAVTVCPETAVAQPMGDQQMAKALLDKALLSIEVLRSAAASELTRTLTSHATTLAKIRSYAIDAYHDGSICYDGLNAFLRTFGLDEYGQYLRIHYAMTGVFTVAGTEHGAIVAQAREALRPDLSELTGVEHDTSVYTANAEPDRAVQLADGRSGREYTFTISGVYEVDDVSTSGAETDCRDKLRPYLSDIPDLVSDSLTFTFQDVTGYVVS